jgi:hypothetical protein
MGIGEKVMSWVNGSGKKEPEKKPVEKINPFSASGAQTIIEKRKKQQEDMLKEMDQ